MYRSVCVSSYSVTMMEIFMIQYLGHRKLEDAMKEVKNQHLLSVRINILILFL